MIYCIMILSMMGLGAKLSVRTYSKTAHSIMTLRIEFRYDRIAHGHSSVFVVMLGVVLLGVVTPLHN